MSLISVINSIKKCAKGCYKNIFLQAILWDSLTPKNTVSYQFPQYFILTERLVFSQIFLVWCGLGWLSWSSSSFPQKELWAGPGQLRSRAAPGGQAPGKGPRHSPACADLWSSRWRKWWQSPGSAPWSLPRGAGGWVWLKEGLGWRVELFL